MKFIKFEHGNYIRSDKLIGFSVELNYDGEFTVWATLEDTETECLNRFGTKVEAQAWLDELVAKLNAEETT